MNFKSKMNQTCTHWVNQGLDANQSPSFGSPTTRKCRREVEYKTILDEEGEERTSKAVYYLDEDDGSISAGDFLAEGDQTGTSDPLTSTSAERVIGREEAPSLRDLQTLHLARV